MYRVINADVHSHTAASTVWAYIDTVGKMMPEKRRRLEGFPTKKQFRILGLGFRVQDACQIHS